MATNGDVYDCFGDSVGIFNDTIIVGAWGDGTKGTDAGVACVFIWVNDALILQSKFVASDGAANNWFGDSVGICGNTAIVGAEGDDDRRDNSGSEYLFICNGDTWTYQGKLVAPDGSATDWFGSAVGIYGNTAVIGAYKDDDNGNNSGSTYVYVQSEDEWILHAKLLAPAPGEKIGQSVGDWWFNQ